MSSSPFLLYARRTLLLLHHPESASALLQSITSHSINGDLPQAFASFSRLHSLSPSSLPLLLPAISSLLSSPAPLPPPASRQLHSLSLSLGHLPHPNLLPRLTYAYASSGDLSAASSLASLSTLTPPWNILISSYATSSLPKNALKAFAAMLQTGAAPDAFTYPSLLKACADTKNLPLGRRLHCRCVVDAELASNLFVSNTLTAMYAKCGKLGTAREVFDGMSEKDAVSWNSIISGYASRGMWEEAFELFERMQAEGSQANSVSWNTIIGGKMRMGCYREALGLISHMRGIGVWIDFVTVVVGLNACSRIRCLKLGREIHGLAVRSGWDASESVNNSLITMYSRCGNARIAQVLFGRARSRSLVTWNCMVTGFAINDRAEEASVVFRDLVRCGLEPNYVTVVTYLALCGRVANLQHGRELHCFVTKNGYEKNYRLLWNSLIDMYAKSGKIALSQRVFDMMTDRDQFTFTSLIAGYGAQGEGKMALKLFDEMISCRIRPDNVSMVAVLSACSHSGLISEGQWLFEEMVESYGIEPTMEHYSCMVDIFARAGLLEKAEDMLHRMPFPPSVEIWAALTSACLVCGNMKIGERAAKRLLETKTGNAGHYVLIANMYAAAGCWEELAKVRTMMRDLGVRKAPGCAWADLGNGFRPFLVADRSSSLSPEIYKMLDELSEQMRDVGHVDSEELGLDEEILITQRDKIGGIVVV